MALFEDSPVGSQEAGPTNAPPDNGRLVVAAILLYALLTVGGLYVAIVFFLPSRNDTGGGSKAGATADERADLRDERR